MRPLSGTKVFSCLLLLSSAITLAAQSTLGDITGTVHDATGADIANASVTLVNTDSGIKSSQTSGGDGSYRFQQVAPCHYRLEIAAAGFSKTGISNLTMNLDAHLTQDVSLSVG
ncbi:MAG: carboxypeptidase regulatory-like domain-containing protein, partial [Acidobacteriaceae bacterium]|nr:carboxypeptidase regulatory-like domain-containing protein [Acidobacteriaceae bacterium]